MTRPVHCPPSDVVLLARVDLNDCEPGLDVEEVELVFEVVFKMLDRLVGEPVGELV